ncbi:histidine phosphatase family protein [Pseudomonas sp. SWRI50]|uniref:phosphoglycerate mutase family protein n=1 Tax=Pseudomonas sp. SWRI50 TaxID=2745484 RepID=UPI001646360D|nr:phosphoglycerate mutase family protein [Pseudomonas sp. SWRI50]MBC3487139.1 histidine phosphatase family protein [Pseudomonas sp. SWRI50]
MKYVRLIRHGESAANSGEGTRDLASILLAIGLKQAQMVANSHTSAPDLIIASPFLRTQATALVTTAIYLNAAFETLPVHELVRLSISALELHAPLGLAPRI